MYKLHRKVGVLEYTRTRKTFVVNILKTITSNTHDCECPAFLVWAARKDS